MSDLYDTNLGSNTTLKRKESSVSRYVKCVVYIENKTIKKWKKDIGVNWKVSKRHMIKNNDELNNELNNELNEQQLLTIEEIYKIITKRANNNIYNFTDSDLRCSFQLLRKKLSCVENTNEEDIYSILSVFETIQCIPKILQTLQSSNININYYVNDIYPKLNKKQEDLNFFLKNISTFDLSNDLSNDLFSLYSIFKDNNSLEEVQNTIKIQKISGLNHINLSIDEMVFLKQNNVSLKIISQHIIPLYINIVQRKYISEKYIFYSVDELKNIIFHEKCLPLLKFDGILLYKDNICYIENIIKFGDKFLQPLFNDIQEFYDFINIQFNYYNSRCFIPFSVYEKLKMFLIKDEYNINLIQALKKILSLPYHYDIAGDRIIYWTSKIFSHEIFYYKCEFIFYVIYQTDIYLLNANIFNKWDNKVIEPKYNNKIMYNCLCFIAEIADIAYVKSIAHYSLLSTCVDFYNFITIFQHNRISKYYNDLKINNNNDDFALIFFNEIKNKFLIKHKCFINDFYEIIKEVRKHDDKIFMLINNYDNQDDKIQFFIQLFIGVLKLVKFIKRHTIFINYNMCVCLVLKILLIENENERNDCLTFLIIINNVQRKLLDVVYNNIINYIHEEHNINDENIIYDDIQKKYNIDSIENIYNKLNESKIDDKVIKLTRNEIYHAILYFDTDLQEWLLELEQLKWNAKNKNNYNNNKIHTISFNEIINSITKMRKCYNIPTNFAFACHVFNQCKWSITDYAIYLDCKRTFCCGIKTNFHNHFCSTMNINKNNYIKYAIKISNEPVERYLDYYYYSDAYYLANNDNNDNIVTNYYCNSNNDFIYNNNEFGKRRINTNDNTELIYVMVPNISRKCQKATYVKKVKLQISQETDQEINQEFQVVVQNGDNYDPYTTIYTYSFINVPINEFNNSKIFAVVLRIFEQLTYNDDNIFCLQTISSKIQYYAKKVIDNFMNENIENIIPNKVFEYGIFSEFRNVIESLLTNEDDLNNAIGRITNKIKKLYNFTMNAMIKILRNYDITKYMINNIIYYFTIQDCYFLSIVCK